MKKVLSNSILLIFALLISLTACNNKKTTSESVKYTCPMHPDIIRDEMGTCPICAMDLVPMHTDANAEIPADVEPLLDNVNQVIFSNVKTIYPRKLILADTIELNGKVTFNTNKKASISSFISGRIEKMYVKYNYQMVKAGQKIFEIYSPDLVNIQQEILYLSKNQETDLLERAKNKFRQMGASDLQINALIKSGKVSYRFPVYSKRSGYITDFSVSAQNNPSVANTDEMGMKSISAPTASNNEPIKIREGMYVNAGESVFSIYDNSDYWAEFYVKPEHLKALKEAKNIWINEKKHGISSYIPYFKDDISFATVRVDIAENDHHIGELLKGKAITIAKEGIWIPKTAVYDKGNEFVVFLKKGKALSPHKITLNGYTSGELIGVAEGITENDRIAESAAYLIDSEGAIQTN